MVQSITAIRAGRRRRAASLTSEKVAISLLADLPESVHIAPMTGPLTAGERLAPPNRGNPGAAPPQPPGKPPGRPRRRGPGVIVRTVRGLFGAFLGILLLVGVVGAAGGYMA